MTGFYGGPNGQSFDIKEIFTSKNGLTDSLASDLAKGWTSPIAVGEFVIISYGMPNDENYNELRKIDLDKEGKGYNSTLWRKRYDEEKGNAGGLYYELIASMTGNTPHILVEQPSFILNANEEPEVIYDGSNIDLPVIQFCLPRSQVLEAVETEILDANGSPTVVFDDGDAVDPSQPGPFNGTINNPVVHFALPQSQVIETAIIEQHLRVDELPEVRLDITDDGTINAPVLKFKLPVAQQLLEENVDSQRIDADQLPYIDFDTTDPNRPTLMFYLPQSQVMDTPETIVAAPMASPAVSDIGTVNNPKLRFELPRAIRFYYGSLLGERSNKTYMLSNADFADYAVGDYYINAATGFIYRVIDKQGNDECTFEYVACIQSPLPEIAAVAISPYDATLQPAAPQVTRSFTNSELTAWKLEFQMPKAPTPAVTYDFVGAGEAGNASVSITSQDTITFDFQIPAGSRIFSGTEITGSSSVISIVDAKPGDVYLNSETGEVYDLALDGIWNKKDGSLKGPVGDALKIVREYRIDETDTVTDSLANGVAYIQANYVDENGDPLPYKPDELFTITWVNEAEDREVSYWYFYTAQGQWARVQLTGGISTFIVNTYQDESGGLIDNKTYSVSYVNTLVGDTSDSSDKDKTAFSKNQVYDLISWGTWEDAIAGR